MQQRQCVILQGDKNECQQASRHLLTDFDDDRVLLVSSKVNTRNVFLSIYQKQAQQQLGKEFDAVIFDALDSFNPDSLATLIGTICAGGVLIVFLDPWCSSSLWLQRFNHILMQYPDFMRLNSGDNLAVLPPPIASSPLSNITLTADQDEAVQAILRVVQGHRRRPLVLSADRGRGKSASLGMAAARLLLVGKQRIIVSAPSLATVATLFEHAANNLPDAEYKPGSLLLNGAEICFVAPDVLVESKQQADLVLIDEAAAIPILMLSTLLDMYSRLVFSTTLHGYEGTGRGFALRFYDMLTQKTLGWHQCEISTPIRWAYDDKLEAFSYAALLLNAEPIADELVGGADRENCFFECINRVELAGNESDLTALFGLMVLAHYRTRPSDLQMMLDREDMSIYVMRYQGHIVASAWVVNEGKFDDELSAQIYAGNRRLKGHLLPQSLLAHAGITAAGSLNYQRIVRIVVHPKIQNKGLGETLIEQLYQHAKTTDCDIMGVSFSADVTLINFWKKSQFLLARVGIHNDAVSGGHSVMMLRSISDQGMDVINDAHLRFQQHWPALLNHYFKNLSPRLVISLSQQFSYEKAVLSVCDQQDIIAFSTQQRGFDFTQVSLKIWLASVISSARFKQLSDKQQSLCVMAILQQRIWHKITDKLDIQGKAQAITCLREAVSTLLTLFKTEV